ncbi:MAG TPA: phosphoribosylglycinamide formyltransferase [Phycisphaerales bacterium]|nr:phosphoribosylglycinamide formyltransferase [Phycisphaerales bacterium]
MTAPTGPARLAVLLSGSGRTLLNLHERCVRGLLPAHVALVVASRPCLGADRARERGLETLVLPGTIPAAHLQRELASRRIGWVVLAGYLRRLEIPPDYRGRVVNIHPALLPAFGGPGMHGDAVHAAVLARGCKVSGCTVHLCDEHYDAGPIVLQRCCAVAEDDTPQSLAARVFELELGAYPEALGLLLAGRVVVEDGRARVLPEPAQPGDRP